MSTAALRGVPVSLLPLLTTTGTGVAICPPITSSNIRVHVRGVGTISAGTIIIEEAMVPDYTGTWSIVANGTITGTTLTVAAETVLHLIGTIGAIRARVSVNVTGGGSVSADLVCD